MVSCHHSQLSPWSAVIMVRLAVSSQLRFTTCIKEAQLLVLLPMPSSSEKRGVKMRGDEKESERKVERRGEDEGEKEG